MTVQPNNQSTKQNPVGRFMVAVGAVIENQDTGKILLIQRSATLDWHKSEWEIDYGRLDQFEDPLVGLKREIFEEVGITDLRPQQIIRVWHMDRGPKTAENDLIGITYYCLTTQTQVVLSDEHQQYAWVNPAEALELVKIEGIREDLIHYINLKNG